MDYPNFAPSESVHSPNYSISPNMEYIDPVLQGSITPPHGVDPWSSQQLSRFVMDPNKMPYPYYPNNSHYEHPFHDNVLRGITPFPSAFFPRQGSPSDHPDSICSSTISPHGDSDFGIDHSPSTPQDDMSFSPFNSPQEILGGSQAQQFQLTGLTYVKPGEVNLGPDFTSYGDDRTPQFPGREFSMSSHGSTYDVDHFNQIEALHIPRQMSPAEFENEIKEEIRIPEQNISQTYPLIESDGEKSEDEVDSIEVAYQEEKDEEYKPKQPHKRANSSARETKPRKRSNPSQPTNQNKKTKLDSSSATGNKPAGKALQYSKFTYPCKECTDITFKDESGLERHVKQQHTRPFICVFSFAGCDSTFASKNEWKRHVSSQHIMLEYWLCDQDACAKVSNSAPSTKTPAKARAHPASSHRHGLGQQAGAIFNRKDLYTQHLRRMHIPPHVKKQVKQKKTVPEWEERIRLHQEKAHKFRCELPQQMSCPSAGCRTQFVGAQAWDDRMEHVAKHLEKAAAGLEAAPVFGGELDGSLTAWAARPDVAVIVRDGAKWKLNSPMRPDRSPKAAQPQAVENEDEDEDADAEGEEVEEV